MRKCSNCGTEMAEQTEFCPNCGEKTFQPTQTLSLKCKACGGVLTTDEDRLVLSCPFCGSKELISESDNVTIERIKVKATKELEEMRMKNESEKEVRKEEKDYVDSFKNGKFKKVLIVFAIIFGVLSFVSFIAGNIFSGIVALIQTSLLIVSILMGMQVIKEKKRFFHTLISIVAFVLTIPFFLGFGTSDSKEIEAINWDYIVLNEHLPEPESSKGRIIINDEDTLDVYIVKTNNDSYNKYLSACKDFGYTVNSDYSTDRYSAFNSEGYELTLWYHNSEKEMNISLDSPDEIVDFKWSTSEPGCLLPIPKKLSGSILSNDSTRFAVNIADTSKEEFNEYITACEDKGFTEDYSKGDDYYYAYNKDGYYLSINLNGFDTMRISIDIPSEEETSTAIPVTTEKETEKPTEKATEKATEAEKDDEDFLSDLDIPTLGELNALASAKAYLAYSAFSYDGLIEQLEFEQYSYEEAVYAVENCGADWYEQAAKCAKSYLDFMSFSRDGLIEQLEYEGFTYEQAVYGVEQNGY